MILVTRTDSAGYVTRVEIPEGQDPFAVCAAVARGMGLTVLDPDPEHAAVLAARKKGKP